LAGPAIVLALVSATGTPQFSGEDYQQTFARCWLPSATAAEVAFLAGGVGLTYTYDSMDWAGQARKITSQGIPKGDHFRGAADLEHVGFSSSNYFGAQKSIAF